MEVRDSNLAVHKVFDRLPVSYAVKLIASALCHLKESLLINIDIYICHIVYILIKSINSVLLIAAISYVQILFCDLDRLCYIEVLRESPVCYSIRILNAIEILALVFCHLEFCNNTIRCLRNLRLYEVVLIVVSTVTIACRYL